jgi:flavin reductase (DIM6/NTAB) family NADH-FMN oxidoreductase RutF
MEYVNDLRMVMRRWASGVVIVTSAYEGQRHGMTVDSFNSVSIVPPLVTFTLNNNTRTHALVRQSGWVGITMLHAGQIDLSDRFAGRFGDGDRFAGLDTFTMQSGVPFLRGGMAYLEAKVIHQHEMPTSTLFIAEVTAMGKEKDMEPMVYFDRGYHRIDNEHNTFNSE